MLPAFVGCLDWRRVWASRWGGATPQPRGRRRCESSADHPRLRRRRGPSPRVFAKSVRRRLSSPDAVRRGMKKGTLLVEFSLRPREPLAPLPVDGPLVVALVVETRAPPERVVVVLGAPGPRLRRLALDVNARRDESGVEPTSNGRQRFRRDGQNRARATRAPQTGRGDAAAATWIFRKGESSRRRPRPRRRRGVQRTTRRTRNMQLEGMAARASCMQPTFADRVG